MEMPLTFMGRCRAIIRVPPSEVDNASTRAHNLLHPMDKPRGCKEAGVPYEHCACAEWASLPGGAMSGQGRGAYYPSLSKLLISKINAEVGPVRVRITFMRLLICNAVIYAASKA